MTAAPKAAMILAAGLGARMAPLTETTPKPLLRAGGRALIDHAIDRAVEAGVERVVVNIHHLGAMIREHLLARRDVEICISDETGALLDTGGGVRKALPLLGEAPFFVLSSDVVFRGPPPLARLVAGWRPDRGEATLLLVPRERAAAYAGAGDYFLQDGRPRWRGAGPAAPPAAPYVYTSAQILDPSAFAGAPAGAFSQKAIWDRLEAAGRLSAVVYDGDWVDVGTPAGLAAAAEPSGAAP